MNERKTNEKVKYIEENINKESNDKEEILEKTAKFVSFTENRKYSFFKHREV